MFAFLCMESEHVEIQAMGVFSLLWLVGVHVVCFAYEDPMQTVNDPEEHPS